MNFIQSTLKENLFPYFICDRQKFRRSFAAATINLIAAVLLGTLLLVGAFSLPMENIEENVQRSAVLLKEEGTYPKLFSWCHSQLDNWTDSVILLEAADLSDAGPVEKAMMVYRGVIDGDQTPCDVLTDHYLAGTEYTGEKGYSRYWFGCLIIVKPLLEWMDLKGIRVLNLAAQLLLAAVIGVLLFKRGAGCFYPAYLVVYLILMPVVSGSCLQFSSCYFAFSLGSIALLLLSEEKRKSYAWLVFLNIGIFTAYFDLLTYPVAAFGIPALFYLAVENTDPAVKKIGDTFKNGIAWCFGFGGMWCAKWLVCFILTGYNTIFEALSAFAGRISDTDAAGETISRLECEALNFKTFASTPAMILYVVLVLFLAWKIFENRKALRPEDGSAFLPYFLVSLIPAVWYALTANHSAIHYWFTCKACAVTFLALLFWLTDLYRRTQAN